MQNYQLQHFEWSEIITQLYQPKRSVHHKVNIDQIKFIQKVMIYIEEDIFLNSVFSSKSLIRFQMREE